jgi:hypothetical protein
MSNPPALTALLEAAAVLAAALALGASAALL